MDSNSGDGSSYQGFATPGEDKIVESTSSAVPSPSVPSEGRLEAPKPVIETFGEAPGSSNPALAETVGVAEGKVSTADMLLARETAEEQGVRAAGAPLYEGQSPQAGEDSFADRDSGRPNWPDDRQQEPVGYMDSPRANTSYAAGSADKVDITFAGRVDALSDRAGTQGSAQESRSGLAPVGQNAEEDKYEQREFDRPTEASEIDEIAPTMLNLPPKE